MKQLSQWFKWFFTDKNGRIVIAQRPNIPLMAWFILTIVAYNATAHKLRQTLTVFAGIALLYWATLELFWGDSPFRRVLGGVVLALCGCSLLRLLTYVA